MRFLIKAAKQAIIKSCTELALRDLKLVDTLVNRKGLAGVAESTITRVTDGRIGVLKPINELADIDFSGLKDTNKKTNDRVSFVYNPTFSSNNEVEHARFETVYGPSDPSTQITKFTRDPDSYAEIVEVKITVEMQLRFLNTYVCMLEFLAQQTGLKKGEIFNRMKGVFRQSYHAKTKSRRANNARPNRRIKRKKDQPRRLEARNKFAGLHSSVGFLKLNPSNKSARSRSIFALNNAARGTNNNIIKERLLSIKKDLATADSNLSELCEEIFQLTRESSHYQVTTKTTQGQIPGYDTITTPVRLKRFKAMRYNLQEVQRYYTTTPSDGLSANSSIEMGREYIAQFMPERTNPGAIDTMLGLPSFVNFIGTGKRVNAHIKRGTIKQGLGPGHVLPMYIPKEMGVNLKFYFVSKTVNRMTPMQGLAKPSPGGAGSIIKLKRTTTPYITAKEARDRLDNIKVFEGSDKWYDINGKEVEIRPTVVNANEVGIAFYADYCPTPEGMIKVLDKVFDIQQFQYGLEKQFSSRGTDLSWSVPTEDNFLKVINAGSS